jgi:hypothetical protein
MTATHDGENCLPGINPLPVFAKQMGVIGLFSRIYGRG